jgi:hypothetical protein
MESKTATAIGAGIVTVITPLVFPAIPLQLGAAMYAVAGGLFVYAGRDQIVSLVPERWRGSRKKLEAGESAKAANPSDVGMPLTYVDDPGYEPVELTQFLVGRLAAHPIHPKTVQVLRFIASCDQPEFYLEEAVDAVRGAKSYLDLRGVWAGLTRRTRNILDDPEVILIQWRESYDERGNYVDYLGKVAPMTHASLRKHFRLA